MAEAFDAAKNTNNNKKQLLLKCTFMNKVLKNGWMIVKDSQRCMATSVRPSVRPFIWNTFMCRNIIPR